MKTMADTTLALWQEEGRQLIPQNFEVFRNLVARSQELAKSKQYDMAVVYGEMAASYASGKHCGLFVSLELESILLSVGQQVIGSNESYGRSSTSYPAFKKVLHVATEMKTIGGHSRLLWRWIQEDCERSHSLVLTRQAPLEVPKPLKDAVSSSRGKIHILNTQVGSLIAWAKQLRQLSAEVDLVILHAHNYDVIPLLAFANKEHLPPIILLDHADHLFWLGSGIADVVISLRESGMKLAHSRRHINVNRSVLLPIIIESTLRELSRAEAKRQLNLPEDCVLLLSIARKVKYRTVDGISFADSHLPLLKRFKQAVLIVVGPGNREDWSSAIHQSEGRIKVFSETENTTVFYQAADIYVDSFPFVSNTSLLEAGSYGVPLVSRYPYPSKASGVLGADMPGLTGNLIRVKNLEEYTATLSRLVEDTEFRQSLGEATKTKIVETHWQDGWRIFLNQVYSHTSKISQQVHATVDAIDQVSLLEPDVYMQQVHNTDISADQLIQWHLPLMPFNQRIGYWLKLLKKYGFRKNPPNLLLPEWLRAHYYLWRHAFKSSWGAKTLKIPSKNLFI